jgi:hypothetical protein
MATTAGDQSIPPEIGPPIWRLLEEAFQELLACSKSHREAKKDLYGILRSGACASAWVGSTGSWCLLSAEWWQDMASLKTTLNVADGAYYLNVDYPDYAFDDLEHLSDERGTFFVVAAEFAREKERLHPKILYPAPPAAAQVAAAAKLEGNVALSPEPAAVQRRPAKASEPVDDGRKGPGRPSPKTLVADEIDRLKKVDPKILEGKKTELWERLAEVCRGSGHVIKPKSIGSLIRRNEMLPTQKR